MRKKQNFQNLYRHDHGKWLTKRICENFPCRLLIISVWKWILPAGLVNRANSLTCWYWKNVLRVMQLNLMWWNCVKTLVAVPQKPILQMLGGNSQQQSVIYIFGWLLYTVPLFGALRVVTGSGSNCHSALLACLGTISWHLTASRENIIEKRLITSLHQNNKISLHIPSTIHSLWIVKPNKPTNVNMLS